MATAAIIAAAIEVHRTLGPGVLERIYEECPAAELSLSGLPYERQRAYLRLTNKPYGLLSNFHLPLLKEGIRLYLNPVLLRSSGSPCEVF